MLLGQTQFDENVWKSVLKNIGYSNANIKENHHLVDQPEIESSHTSRRQLFSKVEVYKMAKVIGGIKDKNFGKFFQIQYLLDDISNKKMVMFGEILGNNKSIQMQLAI